jgi:hypothetical protein
LGLKHALKKQIPQQCCLLGGLGGWQVGTVEGCPDNASPADLFLTEMREIVCGNRRDRARLDTDKSGT